MHTISQINKTSSFQITGIRLDGTELPTIDVQAVAFNHKDGETLVQLEDILITEAFNKVQIRIETSGRIVTETAPIQGVPGDTLSYTIPIGD